MADEIVQINEYGEVTTEITDDRVVRDLSAKILPPADSISYSDATETAEDSWASFKVQASGFYSNVSQSTSAFFRENRQLLNTLGLILLAFLGLRILSAVISAIDSIPLITPLLKLVGLGTVTWFTWRYMLRADNRQELAQKWNRAKADLFG